VAQTAFEKAFRSLTSFNGTSSFRTWLHRIVVNLALNHVRDESRSRPASDTLDRVETRDSPNGGDAIAALAHISDERRAVVVLRVCLGYSLAEAAELLDIPLGTVQSRQARGLAELRTILGDDA
jgi:RNA polymerase sigma-70 factor, ECF subfamily